MRETTKTALVPYTVEQMFALVEDFERYPQFVPWVKATRLLERGPDEVVGQLEMNRGPLRETFTTRTAFFRPREITLALIEGPFSTFEGRWTFQPISDRGSKVGLSVRFEFANPVLDVLLSRTFENSCSELVDAFVVRARSLYSSH
ncbi:MAG TPA: type II toxin-antitoxin system RatA family toxin [Povalibacter sp.]|jgi:ribosome-associated toxin RatA of RatAB toxin-antitoxin module